MSTKTVKEFLLGEIGQRAILVQVQFFLYIYFCPGIGIFPLDDTYIHLTLARNLGATGVMGLNPGEWQLATSSLLWTLLLTPIGIFNIDSYIYTIFLCFLSYLILGQVIFSIVQNLLKSDNSSSQYIPFFTCLISICCISQGVIIWHSTSGMETILAIAIVILCINRFIFSGCDSLFFFWAGLLFITRPSEALISIPLILAGLIGRRKFCYIGAMILSYEVLFYFILCRSLTGAFLPPTMVAKQLTFIEHGLKYQHISNFLYRLYAFQYYNTGFLLCLILTLPCVFLALRQRPLSLRTINAIKVILIGVFFLIVLSTTFRGDFQLTRYQTFLYPCITISTLVLLFNLCAVKYLRYSAIVFTVLLLNCTHLFQWKNLAMAHANQINDVYVATAKWISHETEKDAVIASFDVGVLNYFSSRKVLDLGGVSSSVTHRCLKTKDCYSLIKSAGVRYIVSGQDVNTDNYTGINRITFRWPYAANITYVNEFSADRYESPGLTNCARLQVIKINGWYVNQSVDQLKYHSSEDYLSYKDVPCGDISKVSVGLSVPNIVTTKVRSAYSLKGSIRFTSELSELGLVSICIRSKSGLFQSNRCSKYKIPYVPRSEAQEFVIPLYVPFIASQQDAPISIYASCLVVDQSSQSEERSANTEHEYVHLNQLH